MLLKIVLINALVSLSIVLAVEKNPTAFDPLLRLIAPAVTEHPCFVKESELRDQCTLEA